MLIHTFTKPKSFFPDSIYKCTMSTIRDLKWPGVYQRLKSLVKIEWNSPITVRPVGQFEEK